MPTKSNSVGNVSLRSPAASEATSSGKSSDGLVTTGRYSAIYCKDSARSGRKYARRVLGLCRTSARPEPDSGGWSTSLESGSTTGRVASRTCISGRMTSWMGKHCAWAHDLLSSTYIPIVAASFIVSRRKAYQRTARVCVRLFTSSA